MVLSYFFLLLFLVSPFWLTFKFFLPTNGSEPSFYFCRLVSADTKSRQVMISKEELDTRRNEATLLAKMSAPPTVVDSLRHLMDQRKKEQEES